MMNFTTSVAKDYTTDGSNYKTSDDYNLLTGADMATDVNFRSIYDLMEESKKADDFDTVNTMYKAYNKYVEVAEKIEKLAEEGQPADTIFADLAEIIEMIHALSPADFAEILNFMYNFIYAKAAHIQKHTIEAMYTLFAPEIQIKDADGNVETVSQGDIMNMMAGFSADETTTEETTKEAVDETPDYGENVAADLAEVEAEEE